MRFVWLDLETTGLDPNTCAVIAIGMVITDEKLNELARFECLADPTGQAWEPFAFKMHTESGFLRRCIDSCDDWRMAATKAGMFLARQNLDPEETFFAGSSVHFDVAFLKVHAPALLRFASYRLLDVSVFRVLAKAWGIRERKDNGVKPRIAHEPLKDLEGSMADFRYWVQEFGLPAPWTRLLPLPAVAE